MISSTTTGFLLTTNNFRRQQLFLISDFLNLSANNVGGAVKLLNFILGHAKKCWALLHYRHVTNWTCTLYKTQWKTEQSPGSNPELNGDCHWNSFAVSFIHLILFSLCLSNFLKHDYLRLLTASDINEFISARLQCSRQQQAFCSHNLNITQDDLKFRTVSMQLRTLGFNLLFFRVFIASFHNSNLLPCVILALFVPSIHGGSVDLLLFQFIVN